MEKKNENNSGILNDNQDINEPEKEKNDNEKKDCVELVPVKKPEKAEEAKKTEVKEPPVVKERIKPKYRKKLKRLLEVAVLAVIAGLIFGLVARFTLSSQAIGSLFGIGTEEENNKPTPLVQRSAVTFPSTADSDRKDDNAADRQQVSFADISDPVSKQMDIDDDGKTEISSSLLNQDETRLSPDTMDKSITKEQKDLPGTDVSGQDDQGQKSEITGFDAHDPADPLPTVDQGMEKNPKGDGQASSGNDTKGEKDNPVKDEGGKDSQGAGKKDNDGKTGKDELIPDNSGDSSKGSGQNDNDGTTAVIPGTEDGNVPAKEDGTEDGTLSGTLPEGEDPSATMTGEGNPSDINPDGTDTTGQEDGASDAGQQGDSGVITDIGTGEKQGEGSETDTKDGSTDLFGIASINSYKQIMDELHGVAKKAGYSLVSIDAVSKVVNWMSESIETRETTSGIIVADNGVELLALTYFDKVKSADSLEVVFTNGSIYEGSLLSYDTEYNMAVVAVALSQLSAEDREYVKAVRFGNTSELYPGMPIIALGSPNGNANSLEYGYITGIDRKMYLMDGVCSLFTTDITNNSDSEGIVINLDGELIGVISRHTGASLQTGTSTEIYIDSLTPIALKLCNSMKRPYFGIKAEDIPQSALLELSLENGIYVNEVASGSPAEKADIHKGDIITAVNGERIYDVRRFSDIIMGNNTDAELEIDIFRSGRKNEPSMKASVKLGIKED